MGDWQCNTRTGSLDARAQGPLMMSSPTLDKLGACAPAGGCSCYCVQFSGSVVYCFPFP
jgi:hypothetical protein